jgi:hypothetical protein
MAIVIRHTAMRVIDAFFMKRANVMEIDAENRTLDRWLSEGIKGLFKGVYPVPLLFAL